MSGHHASSVVKAIAMEETIHDLQKQVNTALLQSDAETLDKLVSGDCQIIGPKGFKISKDEWIGVHEGSDYEQIRLDVRETEVHMHGDAAVQCDVQESRCSYKGEIIDGLFRVLHVWAKHPERWRLVAVQYTSLSSPDH